MISKGEQLMSPIANGLRGIREEPHSEEPRNFAHVQQHLMENHDTHAGQKSLRLSKQKIDWYHLYFPRLDS